MQNNSNSTMTEPKICEGCMTFYANPKLGKYCSKCFSEKSKLTDENKKEAKDSDKIKDEKANASKAELSKTETELKESRPVQVR